MTLQFAFVVAVVVVVVWGDCGECGCCCCCGGDCCCCSCCWLLGCSCSCCCCCCCCNCCCTFCFCLRILASKSALKSNFLGITGLLLTTSTAGPLNILRLIGFGGNLRLAATLLLSLLLLLLLLLSLAITCCSCCCCSLTLSLSVPLCGLARPSSCSCCSLDARNEESRCLAGATVAVAGCTLVLPEAASGDSGDAARLSGNCCSSRISCKCNCCGSFVRKSTISEFCLTNSMSGVLGI